MQRAALTKKHDNGMGRKDEQKMVPRGLEPRTLRLLAVRSNQLSYETVGDTVVVSAAVCERAASHLPRLLDTRFQISRFQRTCGSAAPKEALALVRSQKGGSGN